MEKSLQEDLRKAALSGLVTIIMAGVLDLKAKPVWSNVLGAAVALAIGLALGLHRRWAVLIILVVFGALVPSLHPYTLIVATAQWVIAGHQVAGWALVLTALAIPAIAAVTILVALFATRDSDPVAAMEVGWRRYRSDHLFGAIWRWEWASYGITDIVAFCPRDDCQNQLVRIAYRTHGYPELICVRCQFGVRTPDDEADWHTIQERVKLEIQRRIRTKEYEQVLASQQQITAR